MRVRFAEVRILETKVGDTNGCLRACVTKGTHLVPVLLAEHNVEAGVFPATVQKNIIQINKLTVEIESTAIIAIVTSSP
jgi:hypothetical protein